MDLEVISTISASVSAITSIILVVVAAWQLPILINQVKVQVDQMKIQGERECKWATVNVCDRYSNDPIIFQVAQRIGPLPKKEQTILISIHSVSSMSLYC